MIKVLVVTALAVGGLSLASAFLPELSPAYAKGRDPLELKCKRMAQQQLGVERGAGAYYSQIQSCVANGGRS